MRQVATLIVPVDKQGEMINMVYEGADHLDANCIETTYISRKDAPEMHFLVQWDFQFHQANPTGKS